jgi:hypothetical protein
MERFDTPAAPLPLKFQSGGRELSALFKWHCGTTIYLFLREIGFLLLDALKRPPTFWVYVRPDSCPTRP